MYYSRPRMGGYNRLCPSNRKLPNLTARLSNLEIWGRFSDPFNAQEMGGRRLTASVGLPISFPSVSAVVHSLHKFSAVVFAEPLLHLLQ